MLAACAGCTEGVDAQFGGVELDFFKLVGFGHHGHGAGGGVDATLAFGGGHALHAVATAFKFEPAVGADAGDAGDDFFVATQIAFVGGNDFDLPAVAFGIASVHAQQIGGKQGGFVAAGAGADFEEDVFAVVFVFGQQKFLQLGIQRFDFGFGGLDFFSGEVFHFGVGQHVFSVSKVAFGLTILAVGFHYGGELGVLLIELAEAVDVGSGLGGAEQGGDFFEPLGEGLEFVENGGFHVGSFGYSELKMKNASASACRTALPAAYRLVHSYFDPP